MFMRKLDICLVDWCSSCWTAHNSWLRKWIDCKRKAKSTGVTTGIVSLWLQERGKKVSSHVHQNSQTIWCLTSNNFQQIPIRLVVTSQWLDFKILNVKPLGKPKMWPFFFRWVWLQRHVPNWCSRKAIRWGCKEFFAVEIRIETSRNQVVFCFFWPWKCLWT